MNREEIEKHITTNPQIYRGKPIIRDTRVPVYLIVGFLELGQTPEEIVADYPDLAVEDVRAVAAYDAFVRENIEVFPLSQSA
jgi:uncharacterized protein (DUF433 family)